MHLHLKKSLTKKRIWIKKFFLYHFATFVKISFPSHFFPCEKFFPNFKFLKKKYFFNPFEKIYFMFPLLKSHISVFSIIIACDTSTRNCHILMGILAMKWNYFPIISMRIRSSVKITKFINHLRFTSYKIYKILWT